MQDTKVSGTKTLTREMVEDIKFGLMDHYMKDTGRMTKLMVEED